MCENEPPLSLEYIEDPYIPKLENCATPSLDEPILSETSGLDGIDYFLYPEDDDEHKIFVRSAIKRANIDGNNISNQHHSDWLEESEFYLRSLTLDQIFFDANDYSILEDNIDSVTDLNCELQKVETNFGPQITKDCSTNAISLAKRWRLKLFATRKSMRDVKVTFIDFSKPYLAKISNSDNYKRFLSIGNLDNSPKMSEPASPASVASADIAAEFASLTVEEQERQRAEWSQELARVEEEINTLRTVLASKVKHSSDLKRKLGITVWKEITDDMNQGIKNVKESQVYQNVESKVGSMAKAVQDTPLVQTVEQKVGDIAKAVHETPIYQKTESVFKTTTEKTSSLFGALTSGISSKLSQIKNSESMRSMEDRVGSVYENVKTKVASRSGSVSSFNDALNENHSATNPSSPTIPEGKPIS